ncbi:MAG: class I SAM-dependent methyltransferase [Candidatus Zixiibacteriota bacterium]
MSDVYDNPKYYEIAFDFRDIAAEVDLFERCFRRYSRIPVKSVLELGCGNSPHMVEFAKRGYQYNGIDSNENMLAYSRQKASYARISASMINADMIEFSTDRRHDFIYVMLGSLAVKNTQDIVNHFKSIAGELYIGGLYLLDWCVQFDPPWELQTKHTWEMERDGIVVRTTHSCELISLVEQTFYETLRLDVNDNGERLSLVDKTVRRAIFPQEFLRFIECHEHFEFVGWWNNWDLSQPLERTNKIDRPIVLVRRI